MKILDTEKRKFMEEYFRDKLQTLAGDIDFSQIPEGSFEDGSDRFLDELYYIREEYEEVIVKGVSEGYPSIDMYVEQQEWNKRQ